jgi:hypothetical protein
MTRSLRIDSRTWSVRALPQEALRQEDDRWHFARVRFETDAEAGLPPREAWLRLEEDVPARDVLDQYDDEALVEAFLVAEEIEP